MSDDVAQANPIEIDTRYAAERWPYICPRGHVDWAVTPTGFHCHACEDFGGEGRFSYLLDRRSRERIPRDRVRVRPTAVAAAYETPRPGPPDEEPGTNADRQMGDRRGHINRRE